MSTIPTFKFALREDLKNDKRFLPTRGEPNATGWDVSVALENRAEELVINPGEWIKIPLGFRMFAPEGWWLELRPRSSTTAKKNIHALYGVIDSDFENILCFVGKYSPSHQSKLIISHGERIGQIIPIRRQEMIISDISNEEYDSLCKERSGVRGTGGFGSSDKAK